MIQQQNNQLDSRYKRCPYCSVELPLDAKVCTGCKNGVGKVDRLGRAKEPVDWKSYLICIISWLAFVFFVWWGFFRDG